MNLNDILNMDIDTFNKLNRDELAKAARPLFNAANKRIKRLEEAGYTKAPAYRSVQDSGGSFSSKNLNLNKLRSEFARAKSFMNFKTSKVEGAKSVEREFKNLIGANEDDYELTDEQIGRMWDSFHRLCEKDPSIKSDPERYRATLSLAKKYAHRRWKTDTILKHLDEANNKLYEQMQSAIDDDTPYIPLGEDDENIPF